MEIRRKTIYDKYKKFGLKKDTRSMDEICSNGFSFQAQQLFMKAFVQQNEGDWKKLLMYHEIGSGKTCTSITMAEEYLKKNPTSKILVILPARLKTNFIDELMSECSKHKYIKPADFKKYSNIETTKSEKSKIHKAFMSKVEENYTFLSFEKFRIEALKATNVKKWFSDFTNDKMVIIDEVHNLISGSFNSAYYTTYQEIVYSNSYPSDTRKKVTNAILFKLLNTYASSDSKLIYMTATPIFDNLRQLRLLASVMSDISSKTLERGTFLELIESLRGKVSYFPGTSKTAYPKIDKEMHEIPITKSQTQKISTLNEKDAFLLRNRQILLLTAKHFENAYRNISEAAPKVEKLVSLINEHQIGKHVIYSTFIDKGIRFVEFVLRKQGWVSLNEVQKDEELWKEKEYKVYASWDGSKNNTDKSSIKSIANHKDNLDGKYLRVILGSPSIKEGVVFKHVQHMHILDPVWNESAKLQIEGRVNRFCSHSDIKNHPVLKRKVIIHYYKVKNFDTNNGPETSDQIIYEKIIPSKSRVIKKAEMALQRVAFDHYLYRKLYMDADSPNSNKINSVIKLPFTPPAMERMRGQKNTCPKNRRPDDNDKCRESDTYIAPNKHGFPCCYKNKSKD